LTKEDRKYKSRELGFTGLCCRHCGGQPGFGRYFPGSFNSFLSGKNSENMVEHIVKECSGINPQLKMIIGELEKRDKNSKSRPPHGSRKKFFFHIWTRLREYNCKVEEEKTMSPIPLDKAPSSDDEDNFGTTTPCDLHSLADSEPILSNV
jgi:hypothetical protein